VAVAVPCHAAAAIEFQGLGTPRNSQPSRKAEKHLMISISDLRWGIAVFLIYFL